MNIDFASKESFKKIQQVLGGAKAKLLQKLSEMPESEVYRLKWMRGMTKEIDALIDGEKTRLPDGSIQVKLRPLTERLADKIPLVQVFKSGVKEGYEQVGVYRQFPLLDKKAIAFLEDYSFDLITDVTEGMRNKIKSQIRLGIINGEGTPKIVKRLVGEGLPKGSMVNASQRAKVIVRTELARAHVQGRMYYYRGVGVKQVQVIGKGVSCPICGEHIGQVYDIDTAPRIPFHPNCTCDIVAVIVTGKEMIIIGSETWKKYWAPKVFA
ncbi:MAG: phage minor head protein [bacterium]